MKGVFERHHRLPAGRAARHLDRVFHGFGSRGLQHGFLRPGPRHELNQRLGQFDVFGIHDDVEAGVQVARRLRLNRRHHLGVRMAHVQGADAAGEIDIVMPVQIGQRGAAGIGREHRRPVGHAQGDGGVAPGEVCLALRTGKLRGLHGVFHCPGLLG